jgi:hypothetical protein
VRDDLAGYAIDYDPMNTWWVGVPPHLFCLRVPARAREEVVGRSPHEGLLDVSR